MAAYDITIFGSGLEYDTVNSQYNKVIKWTDSRVIVVWNGGSSLQGYIQCFDVDTGTGALTAIGSPLSLDGTTDNITGSQTIIVDSSHVIVVWRNNTAGNVKARAFAIDGSGNVSTAGSTFSVTDITNAPSAIMTDATHFIIVGQGAASDGFAKMHVVNTGTWAITAAGTAVEFDNSNYSGAGGDGGPPLSLIDSTHVLVTWTGGGGSEASACVLTIDGSFNLTNNGNFTINNPGTIISVVALDGVNHFLTTFIDSSNDCFAQVIEVNLTTWIVSEPTAGAVVYTGDVNALKGTVFITSQIAGVVVGDSGNGKIFAVSVNGSWAVTGQASTLINMGAAGFNYPSLALLGTNLLIAAFQGTSGDDGYLQAYTIELPSTTSIKTVDGLANASVKTVDDLARASVKTINGLA